MPVSRSRVPLAVVIALLLSLSCPAAATAMGNDGYGGGGGRVGTIHVRGTTGMAAAAAVTSVAAPSSTSKWQQRRLEEAAAPEFGSMLAADQGYISYDTLNKDRQSCGGGCAAQGASYTRPCYYSDHCRG